MNTTTLFSPARLLMGALLVGGSLLLGTSPAKALEWEETTPYYEDDAWYDVSEWFDFNDYNPTDEAFGRWDDETYEAWQDIGTDTDNDWGMYANQDETDDWFYDYYDYDYDDYAVGETESDTTNDYYRSAYRYYDFDGDRLYDAYSASYDWDGDGYYEDVDYYSFNDIATKEENEKKVQEEAESDEARSSRAYTVTGTIEKKKTTDVRGGKHAVLLVKQEDTDKNVAVDLGRQDNLQDLKLESGTKIQVRGPLATIGEQPIVMAKVIAVDGEPTSIDRSSKSRQGKVVDTRNVTIRGQEHTLAIVQARKNKEQKLAVDLGPSDKLDVTLEKGDQIRVKGVPVKTNDRILLMARHLSHDGHDYQITRKKPKPKEEMAARQQSGEEKR